MLYFIFHNICCDLLQEAMDKSLCNRIYITRVLADFDCDTFFPKIDDKSYQQIS